MMSVGQVGVHITHHNHNSKIHPHLYQSPISILATNTMAPTETYRPAFPPSEKPSISYGLPFEVACAQHITSIFNSSRVYIIVSNSISKTDAFTRLEKTLEGKVVGVRKGIRPHTPYDDVLEVVRQVREVEADLIVTLGAGSLTDGAKVVAFVSSYFVRVLLSPIQSPSSVKSFSSVQVLNPVQSHSSLQSPFSLQLSFSL